MVIDKNGNARPDIADLISINPFPVVKCPACGTVNRVGNRCSCETSGT
jgi:hypothetical protein